MLLARSCSIIEKWSLKALESSLELEIMEQFNFNQFVHRCIVGATESKFVKDLPRFSKMTFRLTKSIRLIRIALEVLIFDLFS